MQFDILDAVAVNAIANQIIGSMHQEDAQRFVSGSTPSIFSLKLVQVRTLAEGGKFNSVHPSCIIAERKNRITQAFIDWYLNVHVILV